MVMPLILMFGQHHSVVTLLKVRIQYLFTMKCLLHSACLCGSHARKKLPCSVDDLIQDIYSHFAHSANELRNMRSVRLSQLQHKHPAQTCWLSLKCVLRVLEQWLALQEYFLKAAENDRLVSACTIYGAFKNPIMKLLAACCCSCSATVAACGYCCNATVAPRCCSCSV